MKLPGKLELWIGAGVVGLIVLAYLGKKTADAAKAVGQAVNPVSDQNIFYSGTNAIGGALTGDQNFSLGVWVYDALHPAPDDPQAPHNKIDVIHPVTTTGVSVEGFPTLMRGGDRDLIH
jgi:hypothetical protein